MYKEKRKDVVQIEKQGVWGIKYTVIPSFIEKENFISNDEYKLFLCLKEIYKYTKIDIFTQVALNRIVKINTKRNKNELYKNYSDRSIDFVLYDSENFKIKCCIELNDGTHNEKKRKDRDEFLKEVFEYTNIPLIYIKTSNYYVQKDIKKLIDDSLHIK